MISSGLPPTLEWTADGALRLVDQRRLPGELTFLECRTVAAVADAISDPRGARRPGDRRRCGLRAWPSAPVTAPVLRARRLRPRMLRSSCAPRGRRRSTWPGPSTACSMPWGRRPGAAPGDAAAAALRRRRMQIAADDVAANRRHGRPRRDADPSRGSGADALQRRAPGDRRLRHRARGDPGRVGGRRSADGVGRRDPARPPGRPPDGLGAASGSASRPRSWPT